MTRSVVCAAFCATVLVAADTSALAKPGRGGGSSKGYSSEAGFGLGFMLGAPIGLSGKYWLGGGQNAIDFGIGFYRRYRDRDGFSIHVDFLWHPVLLAEGSALSLPLYVGIGGRVYDHGYNDDRDYGHTHIGARVPIGIAMEFHKVPLDLFFELAFVLDFVVRDRGDDDLLYADFNGAIGLRYWF